MTFGLQCNNITTGELTLSSEAFLFGYLGKATFVSSTSWSGDSISSQAGFSTWTFTSAGPIVCAIGLKASGQTGAVITNISQSGSTWTIQVLDLATTTSGPSGGDTVYYDQRTDSDIYVFGFPSSLPAMGMALYNAAGVLTADLSRRPLAPLARIAMSSSSIVDQTIPTPTKPAIVGYPKFTRNVVSSGHGGFTPWLSVGYTGVWEWNGSTILHRNEVPDSSDRLESSPGAHNLRGPCSGILIEANGLT
jgi:hypothetical protein